MKERIKNRIIDLKEKGERVERVIDQKDDQGLDAFFEREVLKEINDEVAILEDLLKFMGGGVSLPTFFEKEGLLRDY